MSDEKLKAYFSFDDADLSANRSGVLSQRQMTRLKGGKKLMIARAQGRANVVLSTSNSENIHRLLLQPCACILPETVGTDRVEL